MINLRIAVPCIVALATGSAWAEQPPGPPPPAPPYGASITLAQAKTAVAAAEAEAARLHADGGVFAVVQPNGALVLFEKMDGSTYISIRFAQDKARSAALYRSQTGSLPPGVPALPELSPLAGGLPIVVGGKTIGAIGVSGIEGGNDVKVAEAAIAAVK